MSFRTVERERNGYVYRLTRSTRYSSNEYSIKRPGDVFRHIAWYNVPDLIRESMYLEINRKPKSLKTKMMDAF